MSAGNNNGGHSKGTQRPFKRTYSTEKNCAVCESFWNDNDLLARKSLLRYTMVSEEGIAAFCIFLMSVSYLLTDTKSPSSCIIPPA